MNTALTVLKAIPLWLILALAAVGFIWWQHGQIGKARADAFALAQQVVQCKLARASVEALAGEQGKALDDLQRAAQQRQVAAEKAVAEAKASAELDYQVANRLQQERTGGNQCAAATSIINKELDL